MTGVMMNIRTFAFAASVALILLVAGMVSLTVRRDLITDQEAAAVIESDDVKTGGSIDSGLSGTDDRIDQQVIQRLAARVEELERQIQRLQRDPAIGNLQTRIATLERSVRLNLASSSEISTSSISSNDLTQARRELATLNRSQKQLEARVGSLETQSFRPQTSLSSLQLKVNSLESTVRRLESR